MERTYLEIEYPEPETESGKNDGIFTEWFEFTDSGACLPLCAADMQDSAPAPVSSGNMTETRLYIPQYERAGAVYERYGEPYRPRVFRYAVPDKTTLPERTWNFSYRYPDLAREMRNGNYLRAGEILARSAKLTDFRDLVRYTWKNDLFYPLAFYWLCEFNGKKDEEISQALWMPSAESIENKKYRSLASYARGSFDAGGLSEFRNETRDRVRALFSGKDTLPSQHARPETIVLPVVGTDFRSCVPALSGRVETVREELFRRQITDGTDPAESTLCFRRFLERITVSLLPEPTNPYDQNAVQVIFTIPGEGPRQAGYMKREIAAILFPLLVNGYAFECGLQTLASGGAEIWIRRKGG